MNRVLARLISIFQGKDFSLFPLFSFSSLLSLLVLWTGGHLENVLPLVQRANYDH